MNTAKSSWRRRWRLVVEPLAVDRWREYEIQTFPLTLLPFALHLFLYTKTLKDPADFFILVPPA